jgi:DNA-binding response OmpR family regulator
MNDYLSKPVRTLELKAALESLERGEDVQRLAIDVQRSAGP